MKTKLHKSLFIAALALFGVQASNAQYKGYPWGGSAPVISGTLGATTKIQMENFDATNVDGSDDGANFSDNAYLPGDLSEGTYRDKTADQLGLLWDPEGGDEGTGGYGAANEEYRSGSEADIYQHPYTNGDLGWNIGSTQGQEFLMYTINFEKTGNYNIGINYAHGGDNTSKRMQIFLKNTDDLSGVATIMNLSSDQALPSTGGVPNFQDWEDPDAAAGIDIEAGTYVMIVRFLAAGPNYDYVYFTTNSVLSTETFDKQSFSVSNPVNDQLNIKGLTSKVKEVSVYSILGNRVLRRKVDTDNAINLNVSSLSKGVYIVEIKGNEGSRFTQKIIKQ